jgi:predicted Zn-ribbon and HTH transcriptional regulator
MNLSPRTLESEPYPFLADQTPYFEAVDHTSRPVEYLIKKSGVSLKVATGLGILLEKLKIPHRFIPDENWESSTADISPPEPLQKRKIDLWNENVKRDVLLQENGVEIVSTSSHKGCHLFARLNNGKSFYDTEGKEIVPLKRLISKVSNVFKAAFGLEAYVDALVENEDEWAYEIFPIENQVKPGEVDMVGKLNRNVYIMSGGQLGDTEISHAAMQKIHSCFSSNMTIPSTAKREQVTPFFISQRIRADEAAVRAMHLLLRLKQHAGEPIKCVPYVHPTEAFQFSSTVKETKNCPFCDPNIIEKQRIVSGNFVDVFTNYLPYAGREDKENKHLMTVTKWHLENSAVASDKEIIEEHEILCRIHAVILKISLNHKLIIWEQHKAEAGQSVPHRHTHGLITKIEKDLLKYEDLQEHLEQLVIEVGEIDKITPMYCKNPEFVTHYEDLKKTSDASSHNQVKYLVNSKK